MFRNDTGKRGFGFMDLVVLFAIVKVLLMLLLRA